MGLCNVCEALDIPLLMRAHKRGLNTGIPFNADVFYVRNSAALGCGLCEAMWTEFRQKSSSWQDGQLCPQAEGVNLMITCPRKAVLYVRVPGVTPAPWAVLQLLRDGDFSYNAEVTSLIPFVRVKEDPYSSLDFASTCLHECAQHHSECRSNFLPPDRLLYIGDSNKNPRLVTFNSGGQGSLRWATLSYCWGKNAAPAIKLGPDNLTSLEQGVPLDKFDATIRDAIIVARRLEIPYLWVDSLCIIQQHGSADWFTQSSRMNNIYGGAFVSIAAQDSTSVKHGFLKRRVIQDIGLRWKEQRITRFPRKQARGQTLFVSSAVSQSDPDGPLMSRGWTMQESLMPNRILLFSKQGVMWTCQACVRSESGDHITPLQDVLEKWRVSANDPGDIWEYDLYTKFKLFSWQLGVRTSNPNERWRLWWQVIEHYTPRSFTKISDRLIAISGIASLYADMTEAGEDSYCAGIWKRDIPCGLCWMTSTQRLDSGSPYSRTNSAGFPSWSWASVPVNTVVHNDLANRYFRPMARLVNIEVDLVDPVNPYGSVKSGRITVEGPLMTLSKLYNAEWANSDAPMSHLERCLSSKIAHERRTRTTQKSIKEQPNQFVAMVMGQAFHSQMNAVGALAGNLEKASVFRNLPKKSRPLAISLFINLIVLVLRKVGMDSNNEQLYTRHAVVEINTVAWDKVDTGIPLDEYWTDLQNAFASTDASFTDAFKKSAELDLPFLLAVRAAVPKSMPREFYPHRLNAIVIEEYRREPWPLGSVTIV